MAEILPGAKAPPSLPIHLIEEILVRVASPGDLVRASAACTSFRRVVTDASFLRRYRSLHRPLLLGIVGNSAVECFLPAEAPHPNALAVLAFSSAADFSFDHLPRGGQFRWRPIDASCGRVLLLDRLRHAPAGVRALPELAVCDPLTRDYSLLPPIPDALIATTLNQVSDEDHFAVDAYFDTFFVILPSGDLEETQFRVICWMNCQARAAVFVYSSVSISWTGGAYTSWDALGFPEEVLESEFWPRPSYAYGCFYWKVYCNKLLKLDINRMEFSAVNLPSYQANWDVFVFEAGEGRFGILKHIPNGGNPEPLRYSVRQNVDENVNELQVENIIPLPCDYDDYYATGAAEGYIFLHGSPTDRTMKSAFFSLEIKTLTIERLCLTSFGSDHIISYFGFPPFMSPRRI